MKDNKTKWTYITHLAIALIIFVICATAWNLFEQTETLVIVKILSDSCFLPGVLYVGITLLGWVSSKGFFDIFGYSIHGLFYLWKKESYYKQKSLYDYRKEKEENRKPFNWPMLVVGLVFLGLGTIGTIVFLMIE